VEFDPRSGKIGNSSLIFRSAKKQCLLLIKAIESSGIKILDNDVHTILNIIDIVLRMLYSGCLKHDKTNNINMIQSKIEGRHVLPLTVLDSAEFQARKY
jgi:hypothetical protein